MINNIEKRREAAIKSILIKREAIYADVRAKKYHTILSVDVSDNCVSAFESYLESIRRIDKEDLMVPLSRHITSLYRAAHYYVYLETLINRLKAGEDPSLIILDIMSNE